jgi:DNA polymerase I-like protein with 3'-5' exonuclease and polymerase domains
MCGITSCPKKQDTYNVSALNKQVIPPIAKGLKAKGCSEFRTSVYYIAERPLSDDERDAAPLVAVILPNPDPTGAQGMGGTYGIARDIIFEQIFAGHGRKPVRIALMFLVRGYNLGKPMRRELTAKKFLPQAAIDYCANYLKKELLDLKPDRVLVCGAEVARIFFRENDVPTLRRTYNQFLPEPFNYPAQVTFNPYLAAVAPVYIKAIRDDCRHLFTAPAESPPTSYHLIRDFDEALEFVEMMEDFEDDIAFDLETENLYRKASNKILTLQFALNDRKGIVIPYQHRETPFSAYELSVLKKRFFDLFHRRNRIKGWVAHNAKFENTLCHMHFGTMLESADIYDTQAMGFLLDETRSERKADVPKNGGIYTLKQLSLDLMNFRGYDRGVLKLRAEGALSDLGLEELADYGAMDAVVTRRLKKRIVELAREENYDETLLRFTRLFYGPITRLLAHIEMTGFKVDLRTLRKLSANTGPFETRMHEVIEKLKSTEAFHEANKKLIAKKSGTGKPMVGVLGTIPWVLDFSKPDHQDLVFYKTLSLEPVSFSEKSGRPAIDDEFYEAYRKDYLEVELFAQLQETKKMRDTFITKMMDRIDPQMGDPDAKLDQRIRSNIHYSRLVTGRFAMNNPNLGQIPKAEEGLTEGEFGVRKAVKDCFTVDLNCVLLQVDYKVNEVRWAAILAKDVEMARIFNEAAKRIKEALESGDLDLIKKAEFFEDIHRNTASAAFNVPIEAVTKAQRQASKAITFGILFQQSAMALAEGIGVSEEEAIAFQEKFFAKMVGIKDLIADLKTQAEMKGYVEAPHGRRRRFWAFALPDAYANKRSHVARNLRQCVNAPIQGVASDAAMYGGAFSLYDYILKNKKNWLIQNVVHDSCLIQVPVAEVAEAMLLMYSLFVEQAQSRMEEMGVTFNLPLGIDIESGLRWGSLEKWNGTKQQALEIQSKWEKYWLDLASST